MATIVFQPFSQLVTDYVLGASGTETPPSAWTMGLSTGNVGSGGGTDFAVIQFGQQRFRVLFVNEIGVTPAGYARQTIAKSIGTGSTDWVASALDTTFATGGQYTNHDQVTFTFSGAPTPNGANSWVMTQGAGPNTGDLFFAADTAATRTFANGDTEKVTATLKAG